MKIVIGYSLISMNWFCTEANSWNIKYLNMIKIALLKKLLYCVNSFEFRIEFHVESILFEPKKDKIKVHCPDKVYI